MTTTTASLVNEAPTSIDAQEAYRQIVHDDSWRLIRLGARDQLHSTTGYIQFDIKITRKLRVIVKLNSDDTYAVEIGRWNSRKFEYVVINQVRGVYADSLGATVEAMCVEAS